MFSIKNWKNCSIIPDEARTFGMEGMFEQLGIYSSEGQNISLKIKIKYHIIKKIKRASSSRRYQ